MNSAVDVFLSAAPEDDAAVKELAAALTASGLSCFSDVSDRSSAEALTALETCRALVLALSAAANAAPDVVRELERAAGRGIPIIPYALEDVSPSPSIAYFTATVSPIPAWSGDRHGKLRVLVEAAGRALTASAEITPRPALHESRYARARYADATGLQIGVAALLAATVALNAYAMYRDARFMLVALQAQQSITAAEHLGWMSLASSVSVWAVMASTILVFRRARLNLLSFFESVQITSRAIVWRPLVPILNAIWLPRMARELKGAGDADAGSEPEDWPLARYWSLAFVATYVLVGTRDQVLRLAPERSVAIGGVSVALDVLQVVSSVLTYAVLARVLDGSRAKRRAHQLEQISTSGPPGPSQSIGMPTTGPDVLVLHAAGDDAIARSIARALAEYQCRCWTSSAAANVSALAARDLAGFTAVLVVVSRASHASEAMTGLVRSALAGAAPVIPFVVDAPPTGSPLGHYIRSLHWIDGAAGPAALRSDSVRAALASTRVTAGASAGVAVALHASELFAPLQVTAGGGASYRPSNAVRVTARALAFVQIAAASLFGIIALAVAFFPETTTAEAPLNVSIYLAIASLPAWCAFLAWTRVAHSNARALQLPDVGSQAWLLCQVAVPGLSLVLGGRAIGRLWAAIRSDGGKRGWADVVTRFQIAWTAAGMILVVTTIASAVLAALGSIAIALTVSVVQSLATVTRGVLRARIVKDVGLRLDALARRQGSL